VKNGQDVLVEELRLLGGGAGRRLLGRDVLLRVTGKGHLDVLQRVLSQDVLRIQTGEGALALLLAPKGQVREIMAVFVGADQSYVLSPPGRAAAIVHSLDTFLRLSRCAAEPVPVADAVAVLGGGWREAVTAASDASLSKGGWCAPAEALWFGETLLGVPGAVAVALTPEALATLDTRLDAVGVRSLSAEAVELARIRVGFPAWGAELNGTVLSPEVRIDDQAISDSKGCYVGQETIARLRTYGHPTRGLVGVHQRGGSLEMPALPLALSKLREEKARGSLTSWARHPEKGGVGLALVRRELMEPGTELLGDGRVFEVTSLPLW
jgi:folate-binding protein YgfZ